MSDRRSRRASSRLCEEYLISPEGRRLSLEENELHRQLGLSSETLGELVASRLLRSESRSESTYYELSHDALVEPILESRSNAAQIMGFLGIGSGALVFLLALGTLGSVPFMVSLMAQDSDPYDDYNDGSVVAAAIAGGVTALIALVILVSSAILARGSARSLLRFRLAREPDVVRPEMHLQRGLVVGLPVLAAGAVIALAGLLIASATALTMLGPLGHWVRSVAAYFYSDVVNHRMAHGIGLDMLAYLVGGVAILIVGARLCRRGVYRLAGMKRMPALNVPRAAGRSAVLYAATRMFLGGILLLSVVVLVGFDIERVHCYDSPGSMPGWIDDWSNMLAVDCMTGNPNGVIDDLVGDFLLLAALLMVAIPMLRRGIVTTRQVLARPSGKSRIAHADSDEQVHKDRVALANPAPVEPSAIDHLTQDHPTQAPAGPGVL